MRETIEVRQISVEGHLLPAMVFTYSRRRMLMTAIGSALFAVIGVLMSVSGDDTATRLWGLATVGLFGAATVGTGLMVRRPGFVALTRDGIAAAGQFGRMSTPWHAVVNVGRERIGRSEMIVVDVNDPSLIRTSGPFGWLKTLNAKAGMPDLGFPTMMLASSATVLERALLTYLRDPSRRSRIGSADELRAVLGEVGLEPDTTRPVDATADRPPTATRVLLWVLGVGGLLLSAIAALGARDADRPVSVLLGAVIFALVGGTGVLGAWLLVRRPSAARGLAIVAAAGWLFLGWLMTTRVGSSGPTIAIGLALIVASVITAWQMLRWHPSSPAADAPVGPSRQGRLPES